MILSLAADPSLLPDGRPRLESRTPQHLDGVPARSAHLGLAELVRIERLDHPRWFQATDRVDVLTSKVDAADAHDAQSSTPRSNMGFVPTFGDVEGGDLPHA